MKVLGYCCQRLMHCLDNHEQGTNKQITDSPITPNLSSRFGLCTQLQNRLMFHALDYRKPIAQSQQQEPRRLSLEGNTCN